jgi:hypothetical protein
MRLNASTVYIFPALITRQSLRNRRSNRRDGVVRVAPILERVKPFAYLIAGDLAEAAFGAPRAAERMGRPLADKDFIDGLERVLGRRVARRAPERKKATTTPSQMTLL